MCQMSSTNHMLKNSKTTVSHECEASRARALKWFKLQSLSHITSCLPGHTYIWMEKGDTDHKDPCLSKLTEIKKMAYEQ